MTPRPAIPDPIPLTRLAAEDPVAAGVVVVDLATAAADAAGGAPAWIKIAPRGEVRTRDSRQYSFDPEALVARFAADRIELPIDVDHAISKKQFFGDTAPAVGWLKELQARADGLYGRVEWLEAGRAVLAARTHRYVSPTFPHDDVGRASWIHSVSLVAAPALAHMPALASAVPAHPEVRTMKTVLAALGLAATATEAEALAALNALQGRIVDPAKVVAKEVHDAALANLAAATRQLDEIKSAGRKAEVDALMEQALTDKKIVPAQRDQFAALCATDDGLAQVKALLAATPANLAASGLDQKKPGETGAAGQLTENQLAICTAMGIAPDDYKKSLAAA